MVRHLLVVVPPDGIPGVVVLPGAPDDHEDLERAAGAALRPAGPELVLEGVVLHRCRGPLTAAAQPVTAEVAGLVAQVVGEETGALPVPAERPPWYRQGWDVAATAWIDEVLVQVGRERSGPAQVVSSWALSQLLRVPTDAGPAWLKGCAPHFPAEPGVTRWLAGQHPGVVPDVLGADPGRGLLLMAPMPEEPATEVDLPAVGATIADLQLASVSHRGELAALGVPDRGLGTTAARFSELVDHVVADGTVAAGGGAPLRAAVPWVDRRCAELDAVGLPSTLCHGDLHLGNAARGADGVVLYDWSDACWSHPLLDVVHLPQVGSSRTATGSWQRGYLTRWEQAGWSAAVLAGALEAALLVERAFQAVTYADLGSALEPAARCGLQDVLPRILGQIVELAVAAEA